MVTGAKAFDALPIGRVDLDRLADERVERENPTVGLDADATM
ncbi:MAG: hypothetical protein ABIO40_09600 [Devosia sp.]